MQQNANISLARFPSPISTQFDPVMHPTIALILNEFEDE